jgi:prepilin-type N-terminal cleavage/methylation domain-containing protein
MRKAFTIVELLVAMGLFGMLLAASGVIFATAVNAHRTAEATAEISQKLAAITDQLNADFRGLRKEGEILAVWVARPVDDEGNTAPYNPPDIAGYKRFDRIMFFADGDFQTYQEQRVNDGMGNPDFQILTGNVARICYMLARDASGDQAELQKPPERILSRTQHIFTAEDMLDENDQLSYFPLPVSFNDPCEFADKNFTYEYDTTTLQEWKNIDPCDKVDMLSVIGAVTVAPSTVDYGGTTVSASDPTTIHMFLCQGVGQFSVQGWYDLQQRWIPYLEWDEDGRVVGTDFFVDDDDPGMLDPCKVPGVLYSPPLSYNEAEFNFIPGLGRAFKFTFTLYDSKGVFPDGKTFTHIVYLDD